MADCFDVVAVGVADEGAVVVLVVLGPDPGFVQHFGTGKPDFWLSPLAEDEGIFEAHIAFSAADRATVDAFFAAAVAAGAEVLHEPRVWPEYHPNYYGAFVRDPDGHNVEAVCHSPE